MEQTKKQKKEGNGMLGNILGGKITFREPEEILVRDVKKFGDGSAHVIIPKKHIGKSVQITVWRDDEPDLYTKNFSDKMKKRGEDTK